MRGKAEERKHLQVDDTSAGAEGAPTLCGDRWPLGPEAEGEPT